MFTLFEKSFLRIEHRGSSFCLSTVLTTENRMPDPPLFFRLLATKQRENEFKNDRRQKKKQRKNIDRLKEFYLRIFKQTTVWKCL